MRPELPSLPERMKRLPVSERGYPVPAFVATVDGAPDFRVIKSGWIRECFKFERCWLCGGRLGRHRAYVIGPMCAVTRTNSEPPSHLECAVYAATACPFLVNPKQRRRESGMPGDHVEMPGAPLDRNPGVACVWVSKDPVKPFKAFTGNAGHLFNVGEPSEVLWFKAGRPATRAEVLESIDSGCPLILESVKDAPDPEGERRGLEAARERVMQYLPS